MPEAKLYYLYDPVTYKYLHVTQAYTKPANGVDFSPYNMFDPEFDPIKGVWFDAAPTYDFDPLPTNDQVAINELAVMFSQVSPERVTETFVKKMAGWGCSIVGYVKSGVITPEQYQTITGKEYNEGRVE